MPESLEFLLPENEKITEEVIEELKSGKSEDPEKNFELLARITKKRVRENWDVVVGVTGEEGCQPKGSKVLMADGSWKNIEDVKIGDLVLSPQENGLNVFSKVVNASQWFSDENYDVISKNRGKRKLYTCSYNHLIPMNYRKFPRRKTERKVEWAFWTIKNYQASYLANLKERTKKNNTTILMPKVELFMNHFNPTIQPYVLGFWLGDGHFGKDLGITTSDLNVIEFIKKYYPILKAYPREGTRAIVYRFSIKGLLAEELNKLGLRFKKSESKFIPSKALLSDIEFRKSLLAGLIDSDGYLSKSCSYSITTKSEQMANDILFLVHSLGGRGSIKKIKKGIKRINFMGEYFCVSFYLGNIDLPLLKKYKIRDKKFFYLSANRLSIDVVKSNPSIVYGFTLDSPSGWYITDNFVVTHNSGKTSLIIQFGKIADEKWDMRKNILFSPDVENIKKAIIELHKYAVVDVDEAIKILYKLQWYSGLQIFLNIIYGLCRRENKISMMAMPRFKDFNEYFRNHRIKIWIHIIGRGVAMVFVKHWSPFIDDPWLMKENQKNIDKAMKRYGSLAIPIEEQIRILRKSPNYLMEISFPALTEEEEKLFEQLRTEAGVYDEQYTMTRWEKTWKDRFYKLIEFTLTNKILKYNQLAEITDWDSEGLRKFVSDMRERKERQEPKTIQKTVDAILEMKETEEIP